MNPRMLTAAEFNMEMKETWEYCYQLALWWEQNLPQQSARLFRCPEWDFAEIGARP